MYDKIPILDLFNYGVKKIMVKINSNVKFSL